jgi:hypothetical protein
MPPEHAPSAPIELAEVLAESGLELVETSSDASAAFHAEAPKQKLGRTPKRQQVVADEPLVQVETGK